MIKKKLTATKQELSDMLEKKMTYREIGEIYGVTHQCVALRVKKLGLAYTRSPKNVKRIRNDEEKAQRIKLNTKKCVSSRNGIPCDIKWEDLYWPTHCPVLGIELNYFAENREEGSPSFDQCVPGCGYTKENTRIISWRANRIKNDGTAEEHQKIADYMNSLIED